MDLTCCKICPRECGADRIKHTGVCKCGSSIKVARAALHFWEEPCISGTNGSGAVFFSGCPLHCCYCQNYKINMESFGKEISVHRLSQMFLELQDNKAHNINLVSPTPYLPFICSAIDLAKPKLKIPIVYNSSGYEKIEALKELDGYIDIYLPDIKYFDPARSGKYSSAPDYFEKTAKAVLEMYRQVGKVVFDQNGILRRGLVIRHMVMPGGRHDSLEILKWIAGNLPKDDILVSIMSQYTPCHNSAQYPEINRRLTTFEYQSVVDKVREFSLTGFMQEKSAAKEEYIPPFDLKGV
ncbi:MAG: radical SAM protein [Clostridiales bacterium]|nr:radical SAM protein [Clostridiales bacterium]